MNRDYNRKERPTEALRRYSFLFFLLSFTGVASGQQRPYQVIENVRIKLGDGTQLAGHVSIPTSERVPVVLMFNCYARPEDVKTNTSIFQLAANQGYAFAMIYTRGAGKSEGAKKPFVHDGRDAYEVIDWLSKQPWCNGEVAMGGGSYLGFTQWAAMKTPHPALKTIIPMVAAAPGKDFPILNGIPMNYALRWLSFIDGAYCDDSSFDNSAMWRSVYNTHYRSGLAATKLDSVAGKQNANYQEWLRHPTFDSYWSSQYPSTDREFSNITVPILTITGYFDSDQRGAFYYYNMHVKNRPDNRHYLLIGPYDHFTAQTGRHFSRYHYYTFDSTAYVNKTMLNVDWYNHVLKGSPLPKLLKDKVNVYVIGDGWRHSPSLAAMAHDTLAFYMSGHALSGASKDVSALSLDIDPTQLVDTIQNDYTHRGVMPFSDEFPIAAGGNENYLNQTPQLVFDSPRFDKAFDLIGSPVADLYLSVEGIYDADVELRYYEVTAEGKSYPLSFVGQRLSVAGDRIELLKEGRVMRFMLDNSFFMAKRIARGSKIRAVLRPINEAATQKNYSSRKHKFMETLRDSRKGKLKVHSGGSRGSRIYFPGAHPAQ
ncbi:CocE/NonD family hydrolase [Dawidia soli]|uniref:CocE/NonD family hydrolase n=1 Tax=Dawidia soli TaxID=2782352 RepID=A0AAP2D8U4_9BACT|nr:CocE/NonD family hydrolase [Dawidia soli]MBT1687359.1 CocE/NonD family hydrolase [Dawidia soli]